MGASLERRLVCSYACDLASSVLSINNYIIILQFLIHRTIIIKIMRIFWDFKRAFMGTSYQIQDFPSQFPSFEVLLSSPPHSWELFGCFNTERLPAPTSMSIMERQENQKDLSLFDQ